jgi:two-component system nitrate/nitrite response regulator NarL
LIVDDQLLFAEAIGQDLASTGITVLDVATSGHDGVEAARKHHPDLALVDIGLPDGHGVEIGRRIIEESPGTKVVALTALEDERTVEHALQAGLHGYLTKSCEPATFRRALESVVDGQTVYPHRLGGHVVRSAGATHEELLAAQLTPRELQVLQLLAEGASSRGIARRLAISPNTVRTHVQGILSKLQVHSRLEAAAFAVRNDLVKIRP